MLARTRVPSLAIMLCVVAVALAGCFGGSGNGSAAIPKSALSGLVLKPKDVSEVFIRFDEGPLAIADAPSGERADPARFGREGGWKARYRRSGTSATSGPLVIESRADLFEDAGGAEQEFDLHSDELERQVRYPSQMELIDVAIGDEAVALKQAPRGVPGAVVSHTVVWRQSNVVASVTANGFSGKLVLREVVDLARAQQHRLAAEDSGES